MQKQILFPSFINRLFAMTIDLIIMSLLFTPIINITSRYSFIYIFNDFFIKNNIDISNNTAINSAIQDASLVSYATAPQLLSYFCVSMLVSLVLMAIYCIGFWHKFNATPGKILMHMKIVDATSYSAPSIRQYIKRFCSYMSLIIGVWSIVFTKKGTALHDKIANTVVIKK